MVTPGEARARADAVMELHEAGELDVALEEAQQLLQELAAGADLDDPVLRESLYTARFEHAVLLTELGDLEGAAAAYALAAATPADLDDPDQRHEIALARLNQGICLDALGEHLQAVEVYARLIGAFHDADDPVTADQVARARVNRAASFLALERPDEAVRAAVEAQAALDPRDMLASEQYVMAARLEAQARLAVGQDQAALEVLDALATTTSREDPATRAQLAAAAQEAAEVLLSQGRAADALDVVEEAVAGRDDEIDPEVEEALAALEELRRRLTAG